MMEGTLPFTNADRLGPSGFVDLKTKNNNKNATRNMKTIIKSILYLQMTALLVTAVFAGNESAQKQVPFRGSVQALETYDIQFPTMFVDTSGSGNATHLGRFTVTWEFTVNLLTIEGIGSA